MTPMLIEAECPNCLGCGLQHSPGCNGDPDDDGVPCERCGGTGVVEYDLNDEIEEPLT